MRWVRDVGVARQSPASDLLVGREYGSKYAERLAWFPDDAAWRDCLAAKKFSKSSDAYKHYSAGRLRRGQIPRTGEAMGGEAVSG